MYGQLDAEAVWNSPNSSIKSNAISQDCIVVEHASIFNKKYINVVILDFEKPLNFFIIIANKDIQT